MNRRNLLTAGVAAISGLFTSKLEAGVKRVTTTFSTPPEETEWQVLELDLLKYEKVGLNYIKLTFLNDKNVEYNVHVPMLTLEQVCNCLSSTSMRFDQKNKYVIKNKDQYELVSSDDPIVYASIEDKLKKALDKNIENLKDVDN